ncbi:MAG TPA: metallopeptidase TldD-related protein [Ktedonobacteraceae bacterium]|nr:metallopeptidase TldD-related protein [Ktedonobacteraceae bacterium]
MEFIVNDTLDAASYLINAAHKAGADDAEVFLRVGPVTTITLQEGHRSESWGCQTELALRLWCADRTAVLTTTDFTHEGLTGLARRGVHEARERGTHLSALLREGNGLQIYDDAFKNEETVESAEKAALLESMVANMQCKRDALNTILNLSYTETALWTVLVNSRGLTTASRRQQYKLWVWLEGSGGHLAAAAAGRTFSAHHAHDLVSYIDACTAFLEQPASPVPQSGPCQVLLSPGLAADFARSLGHILIADNVLRNLRPLLERVGTPIASRTVTLIDDGCMPDGLNSSPIDDEGTPTTTTTLLENGRLCELLQTLRSAQELGVAPNGKAMRAAPWHHPKGAPTNIYIPAGEHAPESLRQNIRRGLAVAGVLRPGRVQSATGNFTAVVQGWWIENGTPVQMVSGVTLTANIFQMLRAVRARGNDLQFSPLADGAGAPSLLIDQMQAG